MMKQKSLLKFLLAAVVLFVLYRAYIQVPARAAPSEGYSPFLKDTYPFADSPAGVQGITNRPVRMGPSTTPSTTSPPLPVSTDLLPTPVTAPTNWGAEYAPRELTGANLLSAVQSIGTDTVGSSLRIPNLTLRADPPIEKKNIAPWLQSTVDPDLWRKSLDC